MGTNYDTKELNTILRSEGFRGDIPEDIGENSAQIEFCEIDKNWELEGSTNG